jgi:hypothetical protein
MSFGNRLELERDVVSLACAVSAGIHAALVGDHFGEGFGAGMGFLAATVLLAIVVVGLSRRPVRRVGLAGAAAVLAGLIAVYAFAITTGLPMLHPEPESIDGLALATKAVEALGLIAALHLIGQGRPAAASRLVHMKGAQA